uniref:Ribosomal protein L34 n=1 Tax=Polysiphonia sertularioides TaxID=945028 RepID=A0A1Z1M8U3_9FLOR|nr:ribosomal protein L34 [Polysiphonia sertularioides]ARW62389.1 ribosomal protein L34 [Polysiphonia sertularioides]
MKTASNLKIKRRNGFLIRMKTQEGRKIIASRRKKRRNKLTTR